MAGASLPSLPLAARDRARSHDGPLSVARIENAMHGVRLETILDLAAAIDMNAKALVAECERIQAGELKPMCFSRHLSATPSRPGAIGRQSLAKV